MWRTALVGQHRIGVSDLGYCFISEFSTNYQRCPRKACMVYWLGSRMRSTEGKVACALRAVCLQNFRFCFTEYLQCDHYSYISWHHLSIIGDAWSIKTSESLIRRSVESSHWSILGSCVWDLALRWPNCNSKSKGSFTLNVTVRMNDRLTNHSTSPDP